MFLWPLSSRNVPEPTLARSAPSDPFRPATFLNRPSHDHRPNVDPIRSKTKLLSIQIDSCIHFRSNSVPILVPFRLNLRHPPPALPSTTKTAVSPRVAWKRKPIPHTPPPNHPPAHTLHTKKRVQYDSNFLSILASKDPLKLDIQIPFPCRFWKFLLL